MLTVMVRSPSAIQSGLLGLFFMDFFYCVHALWVAAGEVVCHINGVQGQPCRLYFSDLDYLKRLIKHWHDWFLDELQYMLQTNWPSGKCENT